MLALMSCACCSPAPKLRCATCAVPPPAHTMRLTARLLSGAVLAKVAVRTESLVADLKRSVEAVARLPEGRWVRKLVWGIRELRDEELLHDVGLSGDEELVAICEDGLVGDFESFGYIGCPCCDGLPGFDLTRVRFRPDGTALIFQSARGFVPGGPPVKYRYTLGASDGGKTQLRLVEDAPPSSQIFYGTLQVSAPDHTRRRVQIPELDIDVQDVRSLKEEGRSFLQTKMWSLQQYYKDEEDLASSAAWWGWHLDAVASPTEVEEAVARVHALWRRACLVPDDDDVERAESHNRSLEGKRGKAQRPHKRPPTLRCLRQSQRREVVEMQARRKQRMAVTQRRQAQRTSSWLHWPASLHEST